MQKRWIGLAIVGLATFLLTGCGYRTVAKVEPMMQAPALSADTSVLISESALEGRKYQEVCKLEVSVQKPTLFHPHPTKAQANEALSIKAREMGADAVMNVKYKSGVGLSTWGYMDATGTGVKLQD